MPVIDLNQIESLVKKWQAAKKTIVLVGGCFDILHQGHFEFLKAAKKEGDILMVALESDEKVTHLKGPGRPVNKAPVRAENLIKTNLVHYVVILPTLHGREDYLKMVQTIKPDIIAVTADDPKIARKEEQAKLVGGQIKVVIKRLPGLSTTEIVNGL